MLSFHFNSVRSCFDDACAADANYFLKGIPWHVKRGVYSFSFRITLYFPNTHKKLLDRNFVSEETLHEIEA